MPQLYKNNQTYQRNIDSSHKKYYTMFKAKTKTAEQQSIQRVGGWCEPMSALFQMPIPSELKI